MSKLGVLIWRYLFESGDAKRLAKQVQDLSDLQIVRDLPYIDDGEQGHLFDLYELPGLPADAPVLVNIHGGGSSRATRRSMSTLITSGRGWAIG